jgi:predicted  nucleic acid-binding Zn-ribbon protein
MSLQEKLYQLFLLDQQVRGLRSRLDQATRRQNFQQTRHDRLAQQRRELEDQLKHAQATAANLESEAQGVEDRVAKLRDKMNNATSNKEYQALLIEVNTFKNDKGKLEEEALEYLAKVEQLSGERDELATRMTDQEKMVAGAAREVEACRAEIGERLAELTAERDEAARQVPADSLAIFEKAANVYDGEALAKIVEQSRRHMEYTCGGCFLQIPVERVSALMGNADEVVECPGCNRILYMESELKESLTG